MWQAYKVLSHVDWLELGYEASMCDWRATHTNITLYASCLHRKVRPTWGLIHYWENSIGVFSHTRLVRPPISRRISTRLLAGACSSASLLLRLKLSAWHVKKMMQVQWPQVLPLMLPESLPLLSPRVSHFLNMLDRQLHFKRNWSGTVHPWLLDAFFNIPLSLFTYLVFQLPAADISTKS